MKRFRDAFTSIILLIFVFLFAGCASLTGLANREIQENKITVGDQSRASPLQASVLGMSENRRGILVRDNRRLPDGTPSLYFCAEPPPDVAMSTRAGLAAGLALTGQGDARLSDEYTRIAMQLSNRTSLLDIYRTAVFTLCQMHMNGAITHVGAESLFREISLEVIKKAPSTETPRSATQGLTFGEYPKITPNTSDKLAEPTTKEEDSTSSPQE